MVKYTCMHVYVGVYSYSMLHISVELRVTIVLTVEANPSATRLSSCVWVSVSSLICSSVLLSIRAKHLHEQHKDTQKCTKRTLKTLVSDENVKNDTIKTTKKSLFSLQRQSLVHFKQKGAFLFRRWQQSFTQWQSDSLIYLYLSRNCRTETSNPAEAKRRSFSIRGGALKVMCL